MSAVFDSRTIKSATSSASWNGAWKSPAITIRSTPSALRAGFVSIGRGVRPIQRSSSFHAASAEIAIGFDAGTARRERSGSATGTPFSFAHRRARVHRFVIVCAGAPSACDAAAVLPRYCWICSSAARKSVSVNLRPVGRKPPVTRVSTACPCGVEYESAARSPSD